MTNFIEEKVVKFKEQICHLKVNIPHFYSLFNILYLFNVPFFQTQFSSINASF